MKSTTVLGLVAAAGLGGLAWYLLRKRTEQSLPPAVQPRVPPTQVTPVTPTKPPKVVPGQAVPPKPSTDVSVQPLVDLKSAGFRPTQQTFLPSALKQQDLWAGAKVKVDDALIAANAKLPPNNALFYWAYRGPKGEVLLRVMQRNTQNETWYQETTVYFEGR